MPVCRGERAQAAGRRRTRAAGRAVASALCAPPVRRCRFAKCHKNLSGTNVTSARYDEAAPSSAVGAARALSGDGGARAAGASAPCSASRQPTTYMIRLPCPLLRLASPATLRPVLQPVPTVDGLDLGSCAHLGYEVARSSNRSGQRPLCEARTHHKHLALDSRAGER